MIKNKNRNNIILFSIFVLFSFLYILPIVKGGIIISDDISFHLTRFNNLFNDLSFSNIRPRIFSQTFKGAGYATGIFYPDLFFYPFVLLSKIGLPRIFSFSLYIFSVKLFSTVSYYYCFNKIYKIKGYANHQNRAVLITVLMFFDIYTFYNFYYRGAVGEYTAAAFIPWIILGIFYIFNNNKDKWYVLALSITAVLYSHLITAFLSVCFIGFYYIYKAKIIYKNPDILLSTIKAAFLSVLLSLAFLVPFLEETMFGNLFFKFGKSMAGPIEHNVLFYLGNNEIIGLIILLLLITVCFFIKDIFYKFIVSILITFFSVTTMFPWETINKYIHISGIIQFPWRLFTILIPISFMLFINVLFQKRKKYRFAVVYGSVFLMFIPLILFSITLIGGEKLNFKERCDESKIDAVDIIGFGEYLPYETVMARINDLESKNKGLDFQTIITDFDCQIKAGDKTGTIKRSTEKDNVLTYKYKVNSDSVILLDKIYYKNYNITVNGNPTSYKQGENGLIEIDVPKSEGMITVKYEESALQGFSLLISVMTILLLIPQKFNIYKKRKNNT